MELSSRMYAWMPGIARKVADFGSSGIVMVEKAVNLL